VFRSKRADRVKMLVYDGTGLVLIWKRLNGARFKMAGDQRRGDAVVRGATGGTGGAVRQGGGFATSQESLTPPVHFVTITAPHLAGAHFIKTRLGQAKLTQGATFAETNLEEASATFGKCPYREREQRPKTSSIPCKARIVRPADI
jgi:IS66 Orf2 like protein